MYIRNKYNVNDGPQHNTTQHNTTQHNTTQHNTDSFDDKSDDFKIVNALIGYYLNKF
jgi:hypothetical protein